MHNCRCLDQELIGRWFQICHTGSLSRRSHVNTNTHGDVRVSCFFLGFGSASFFFWGEGCAFIILVEVRRHCDLGEDLPEVMVIHQDPDWSAGRWRTFWGETANFRWYFWQVDEPLLYVKVVTAKLRLTQYERKPWRLQNVEMDGLVVVTWQEHGYGYHLVSDYSLVMTISGIWSPVKAILASSEANVWGCRAKRVCNEWVAGLGIPRIKFWVH